MCLLIWLSIWILGHTFIDNIIKQMGMSVIFGEIPAFVRQILSCLNK